MHLFYSFCQNLFCTCVIIYKPAIWIYSFIHISFWASWVFSLFSPGWAGENSGQISVMRGKDDTFLFAECNSQAVIWAVIVVFSLVATWHPRWTFSLYMCKVWYECTVLHIPGHVCSLCEGEGICNNVLQYLRLEPKASQKRPYFYWFMLHFSPEYVIN